MDEKIDTAEKKVLVDIVKLLQKRGIKGSQGGWKEFLNSYDRKFGASLSDPTKRSHEVLAAFIKTFSKEDDLKFIGNVLRRHSNQEILEQLKEKSYDTSEQRLVQVTLRHPLYPLDYSFASLDEDWVIINLKKKSKVMRSTAMVAVDCEMVLCEDGTEAVVKVCVVDRNSEVKLHEFVKPSKAIADYRTEITGISAQDLEGITCSLADIQKSMKKLLSNGTILVGHSLHNDLHALKLDYVRVIDTSYIFQCSDGPIHKRPSLNNLCKAVLGYEVRKKCAPHNCLDDAHAAMKLVLAMIEQGVDKLTPLVQEHILECEMTKLLIHNIPTSVKSDELHKVVPGDFTMEVKPSKKVHGDKYSAIAIFSNQREADDAYESVEGSEEKDSSGRRQKLVTFQLSTGVTTSIYVRKMVPEGPHVQSRNKRALQVDETFVVCKKVKNDHKTDESATTASNQCDAHLNEIKARNGRVKKSDEVDESSMTASNQSDAHLNEIKALNERLKKIDEENESLRQQLKQKDFEISVLNKMVSNLRKGTK
ncbi:hypothetical protein L6164_027851 [Bauhinia variegata]|uniref:Uncharacterized protein n=1 Tax=Bauhinia variegata TaxID=167791 RepID=A0ACB9LVC0_BAUVA|nr:hypothetical protein L6164_027851 [Bauhinia variegata]